MHQWNCMQTCAHQVNKLTNKIWPFKIQALNLAITDALILYNNRGQKLLFKQSAWHTFFTHKLWLMLVPVSSIALGLFCHMAGGLVMACLLWSKMGCNFFNIYFNIYYAVKFWVDLLAPPFTLIKPLFQIHPLKYLLNCICC